MFWRSLPRLALQAWALQGWALLASISAASAGQAVAMVETISDPSAALRPLDYVETGRRIQLAPSDELVLGYFRSCIRETIRGGAVVIGETDSVVTGGTVRRERVECDGGHLQLAALAAASSSISVVRNLAPPPNTSPARAAPAAAPDEPDTPRLTLYGSSPIVELGPARMLRIERLDASEPPLDLTLSEPQILSPGFVDFVSLQRSLTPGGTYRLSAGSRQTIVKLDPGAKPGPTPVLGRLVRF